MQLRTLLYDFNYWKQLVKTGQTLHHTSVTYSYNVTVCKKFIIAQCFPNIKQSNNSIFSKKKKKKNCITIK